MPRSPMAQEMVDSAILCAGARMFDSAFDDIDDAGRYSPEQSQRLLEGVHIGQGGGAGLGAGNRETAPL